MSRSDTLFHFSFLETKSFNNFYMKIEVLILKKGTCLPCVLIIYFKYFKILDDNFKKKIVFN